MPELRKDPIVGRWVVFASERAKRPQEFQHELLAKADVVCPFCAGHEDLTPPEIIAGRDPQTRPNTPGWRVRVVPNKFPALQVEGTLEKRGQGMYDRMAGVGAHEVIIECPHHERSLSQLPNENVREVLWVYRERLVDLKRDNRLAHGLIFKNEGAMAGASLEHSHSQLVVMPMVPSVIQDELNGGRQYFSIHDRCIFCDIVQQELADENRIVLESSHFVVFCPYASRIPFETWIIPKLHGSHYENISRQQTDELSLVLKITLSKLEAAIDRPPFNYYIHSAPFDAKDLPQYHWHMEILPRLSRLAGFEWGSGSFINPVFPEQAAAFLRETEVDTRLA